MIAHKLATIENCDKIIVMNDGKLHDEGTHEQLMARKSIYAKLKQL